MENTYSLSFQSTIPNPLYKKKKKKQNTFAMSWFNWLGRNEEKDENNALIVYLSLPCLELLKEYQLVTPNACLEKPW